MRKPKKTKLRDRDSNYTYSDYRNSLPADAQEPPTGNPDVLAEDDSLNKNYERGDNFKRSMKILDKAIEHLSEREKIAYVGYYREGKTEAEIGEELGIDGSNVSRMLSRALTSITEYCKEAGHDLAAEGGDDAH